MWRLLHVFYGNMQEYYRAACGTDDTKEISKSTAASLKSWACTAQTSGIQKRSLQVNSFKMRPDSAAVPCRVTCSARRGAKYPSQTVSSSFKRLTKASSTPSLWQLILFLFISSHHNDEKRRETLVCTVKSSLSEPWGCYSTASVFLFSVQVSTEGQAQMFKLYTKYWGRF